MQQPMRELRAMNEKSIWPRMRLARHAGGGERGATLVEFALVSVIFFTMVFSIIQGGIIFGSWIIVTNAAREGARYASVCISRGEMPDSLGSVRYCDGDSGWGTQASIAGPSGLVATYTKSKVAWPDPNDPAFGMSFNASYDTDLMLRPRLVRVQINYGVPLLAPLLGIVIPNPLPLSAESDMRIES